MKLAFFLLLTSTLSFGLPVNFGIQQKDIKYNQFDSKNFSVYHDARVRQEPLMILNTLEGAKPVLEKWFEKDRAGKPLPVIASAVTSEASFANWILDQIELQTYGQFDRDLAWHEYTHSTMYLHFYNIFGPPGATINLIWLPSWYIEGLAETLSVSVGSSTQMMLEKYHALSGDWPSFDKLHSLYTDSRWAQRGYPASGAFVRWIALRGLKKNLSDDHLVQLLKDFKSYSQPWWWPWASVPFNNFMPFDKALENQFDQNAEKLWEEYKKEAKAFWEKSRIGPMQILSTEPKLLLSGIETLQTLNNNVFFWGLGKSSRLQRKQVLFDEKTQWAIDRKDLDAFLPPDSAYAFMIQNKTVDIFVKGGEINDAHIPSYQLMARRTGTKDWKKITSFKTISKLIDAGERIAWIEIDMEKTSFCFLTMTQILKQITSQADQNLTGNCRHQEVLPRRIEFLGQKTTNLNGSSASEVWFKTHEQTLKGDNYGILVWNADNNKITKLNWKSAAEPKKLAFAGDDPWVLVADGLSESLWKLSPSGECLGKIDHTDYVKSIAGLPDGNLVLAFYSKDGYALRKTNPKNENILSCSPPRGQLSPLIYAMRKMEVGLDNQSKVESPDDRELNKKSVGNEDNQQSKSLLGQKKTGKSPNDQDKSSGSPVKSIPSFREAMLATDLWALYSADNTPQIEKLSKSVDQEKLELETKDSHPAKIFQEPAEEAASPVPSISEKQKILNESNDEDKKVQSLSGSQKIEANLPSKSSRTNTSENGKNLTHSNSATMPKQLQNLSINHDPQSIKLSDELMSAKSSEKFLADAEPLNSKSLLDALDPEVDHTSKDYRWKARPALLFPWIGGEDPFGTQLGIISIPLVDSLQNETVRTTLLWGIKSQYPAIDITASSTRFKSLVSLSLFKKQSYNGYFYNQTTASNEISYYDEVGSRIEVSDSTVLGAMQIAYQWGVRRSLMKRLYGPRLSKTGILNEPGGSIYSRYFVGNWAANAHLSGVFTSPQLSQNFDYNKVELGASLARKITKSNLSLGIETSRIRGKKMPLLRELYSPLKTFIPGSGGGLNQNNFSITPTYGLLSSVQGDTQGRAKLNWTLPVIESIEKHLFIFYFNRLDFSAFYNYGGAWSQSMLPPSTNRLIAAHGYNLDLQFENKGVKFTAGLGTGQIFGRPLEFFAKFSFDNYF